MSEMLVSVVIPTHNRSGMVQRAIRSVLNQTHPNIELVVINDGSTDDTADVLAALSRADTRVRYVNLPLAQGACHARNLGVKHCTGQVVAFLDDDDEFLPTRIATLVANFREDLAYVTSALTYIHKNGRVEQRFPEPVLTASSLAYRNQVGINVLVSKQKFDQVGGFDLALTSSQDHDFLLRLNQQFGDAVCVSELTMVMHTEHELPRITQSKKKYAGYWAFYKKHKHSFTASQRAFHLFKLKSYKRRAIKLGTIISKLPSGRKVEVLRYYLGTKLPFLKASYERATRKR